MAVLMNKSQFRREAQPIKEELTKLDVTGIEIHESEIVAEVKLSLDRVLNLLDDLEDFHDDAMIALGLSDDHFEEPLSKHEVHVLASALFVATKHSRGLSYVDVLQLTRRYNGKAMNLTMVYRTIERLLDRGMLLTDERDEGQNNRARMYSITAHGRKSFRMAVLNAEALRGGLNSEAA